MSTSKKVNMSLDDIADGSKNPEGTNGSVTGPIKKSSRTSSSSRSGPYASQKPSSEKPGIKPYTYDPTAIKRRYTVRVTGLHPQTREGCVKSHFGNCGKVVGINTAERGVVIIQFENVIACSSAIRQLDGTKVNGSIITVEPGQPIDVPMTSTSENTLRSAPSYLQRSSTHTGKSA